jgi:hypothetical protein
VGRWRDEENGLPIDASGEVVGTDVPGAFNGALELAAKLSESDQAKECMMLQWARFAYGRVESDADTCMVAQLKNDFAAGGHNIQQLMLSLTQTATFLYLNNNPKGGEL